MRCPRPRKLARERGAFGRETRGRKTFLTPWGDVADLPPSPCGRARPRASRSLSSKRRWWDRPRTIARRLAAPEDAPVALTPLRKIL